MEISTEMLTAAVKKAVELGVIPKYASEDDYLKNWENIKAIVVAAMSNRYVIPPRNDGA